MKRFDPLRADSRPIEDKALGLLMAMDDAAAQRLHDRLSQMAGSAQTAGQQRAALFCGRRSSGAAA